MTVETINTIRPLGAAEQLLFEVATGDQASFGRLYELTSAWMYSVIRRVLIDVSQSEEVTQEVYLEVWQLADRYNPAVGSATSWMLTIAHRRAIDRVRASQSSKTRALKTGIRNHEEGFDHVSRDVETKLEHERARRALHGLTSIPREALTLAYWDGLTTSEIAENLGISAGATQTRLRDGLIRLRIEMENDSQTC